MSGIKTAATIVIAGAIGTAVPLGLYDYMRKKEKLGRWKAGLVSGSLLVIAQLAILLLTGGLEDVFTGKKRPEEALKAGMYHWLLWPGLYDVSKGTVVNDRQINVMLDWAGANGK